MSWAIFVNFPYPRFRKKGPIVDPNSVLSPPFPSLLKKISPENAKIYEVVSPVFPDSSGLWFDLGEGGFFDNRDAWAYLFEKSPGKRQNVNEWVDIWRFRFFGFSEKILSIYPSYEIGAFWIGKGVNYSKPGFDKRYPVTLQEIEYRTVFLCEKVYEIFKDFVF
ncbi:MAG TPA: hypothetical protein ENK02_13650, partial [Planctomycetes bacterium]|nr:hypothetical protein [Planctomycetota bacterium]